MTDVSGVNTLTADVHNLDGNSGDTAVTLVYNATGYAVGGTTYYYRSAALTASTKTNGSTATFTATASDNAGNSTTTSNQTATWDSNTLTQTTPTEGSGFPTKQVTFHGTASSTNTVTVYYCTGGTSPCPESGSNHVSATPSGGNWSSGSATLNVGTSYTSTAYQTDQYGELLVSTTVSYTP